MDADCIFCKIIRGEIPLYTIYTDEETIAFLDINPHSQGHVLVAPKRHSKNIYDIDEDNLSRTTLVVKKIANQIKKVLLPDGITIGQNNEVAGGQEIFHTHFHIIPKYTTEQGRLDLDEIQKILEFK